MKAKLTLTVDRDIVPQAKRYAEQRGTSVSQMVETALRHMIAPAERLPFGSRWRGKLAAQPRNEARYRGLAKRYGL